MRFDPSHKNFSYLFWFQSIGSHYKRIRSRPIIPLALATI